MKPSTRYSLVGIGALAAPGLVHQCREQEWLIGGPQFSLYLLGVMPNAIAALPIPFVALGIWADQVPHAPYSVVKRQFIGILVVSGIGLIGWEFIQQSSRNLVFDWNDIGATILGLGLAGLLFATITPKVKNEIS